MGRLFWKFFLSILLAQFAATVGIGGAVWLKNRNQASSPAADLDTSPPAEMAINSAAATLEFGGAKALHTMLERMDRHRVFAVDDQGRELLGRSVSPAMLSEARALLNKDDKWHVVRQLSDADGKRYLLFLPSHGGNPMLPIMEGAARQMGGPDHHAHGPWPGEAPDGAGFGQGGPHRPNAPQAAASDTAGAASAPARADFGRSFPPPGEPAFAGGPRGPGDPGAAGPTGPGGPGGPGAPGDHGGPRFHPLAPWVPLVAAILASLLFAVLLAWYFSRPIRALRQAFEAAAGGDLSPRFEKKSGLRSAELNDLGRDFDRMTARLRSLIDGQTRLLHDVSHELRSPLARLQAAVGLAHQQPDKVMASMERIERESVRMDKLVGELLTLSRLEAGAISAAQEVISMAELLDQIVGDANFEAAPQQRSVVLHGDTDVMVTGQADLLARAVENVVRNAVKHSPAQGTVEVEARSEGRRLRIRVQDRGPGVAAADLEQIFQPFFRSSSASAEGHGLGLAIAQHVVQAHGGTISARNRTDGGLCVEISLPVATGKS